MPLLPHSIELHDSELSVIEHYGDSIHVYLTPAYIHRDGKGWTQDVEIIFDEAAVEGDVAALPATIADGHMQTKLGPYHNLLSIPFATDGPVNLELELMSGAVVAINGNGVKHEFKGEPLFIEELPNT